MTANFMLLSLEAGTRHSGQTKARGRAPASASRHYDLKPCDQQPVRQDMEASEVGAMLRHPAAGGSIKSIVDAFPRISMDAQLQPITRTVLRVQLTITPEFRYTCGALAAHPRMGPT